MAQREMHELQATPDGEGIVVVECNSCDYRFRSAIDRAGNIDLRSRVWLERGDRTVNHHYMASAEALETMFLNALYEGS